MARNLTEKQRHVLLALALLDEERGPHDAAAIESAVARNNSPTGPLLTATEVKTVAGQLVGHSLAFEQGNPTAPLWRITEAGRQRVDSIRGVV